MPVIDKKSLQNPFKSAMIENDAMAEGDFKKEWAPP